ncbi:DNA-directed RNA polymerase subunit beta [Evansella sp. AB-P1]|uniref:DNA-directed RNA polymerase subunit beta n=1 Tax=Evansella sp. AB-P1 TaxID=3037653 RepID=UPI00241E93B1|nr:DNA-directed RNA polymerase subunit beta [Evansella sp. AB-P1]MDG5787284.1 DNA-directed RNA polymerase subunit beta [Evansella sp. AB-P1]
MYNDYRRSDKYKNLNDSRQNKNEDSLPGDESKLKDDSSSDKGRDANYSDGNSSLDGSNGSVKVQKRTRAKVVDLQSEADIGEDQRRRGTENSEVEQKDYSLEESAKTVSKTGMSRKQIRLEKEKAKEKEASVKKVKRGRIRIIPVWIRVVFVLALFAGSLIVGVMVGFGIVGEGEPMDVLNRDTWYQLYDLIYLDTELDRSNR